MCACTLHSRPLSHRDGSMPPPCPVSRLPVSHSLPLFYIFLSYYCRIEPYMKPLYPPRGFTVVEDELCRASFPLQKENAYFLEQLKLR